MREHGDRERVLYAGALSMFSGKVKLALAEKGISYRLENVPFTRKGYHPKHPVVAARHPKQQVPVFRDGDLYLWDSTLIFEYLEERYPEPPLYPQDIEARARCRQLEAEADEVFFPNVATLIRARFFGEPQPDGAVEDALKRIGECHAELDARLKDHAFLLDHFTVADIAWFMAVSFGMGMGAPVSDRHTDAQRWLASMRARPSVLAEMASVAQATQQVMAGP